MEEYNKRVQIYSNGQGHLLEVPYPFCTCHGIYLAPDTKINRELYRSLGYMVDGKLKDE